MRIRSLSEFTAAFGDPRPCPVEVVIALDVDRWKLLGLSCSRCAAPLVEHDIVPSAVAPAGKVYAIDRDACRL